MKAILTKALLLPIALTLSAAYSCKQDPTQTSESQQETTTTDSINVQTTDSVNMQTTDSINGHEYVDLGLSVKWATCNVGASSPSDYGDYYAWGETSTKSEYTKENSKTYGKSMGSIAGNSQYDAARANWGSTWRMPTLDEIGELDKCTWTWTTQGGHNGYKVKGPNGNSIFLPAAGWRGGTSLGNAGENGIYWSATPVEDYTLYAYDLLFYSGDSFRAQDYRYYGRSVRPVSE